MRRTIPAWATFALALLLASIVVRSKEFHSHRRHYYRSGGKALGWRPGDVEE